jgi:hypothetical protein
MKKSGFDVESTHLTSSDQIAKLLVFVQHLGVAICLKMGEYYHENVQKIRNTLIELRVFLKKV